MITDTSKRVLVHLEFATDDDPATVHLAVQAAVSDRWPLASSRVSTLDLDAPSTYPSVQLVVDPVGGIRAAFVDRYDDAEQRAKDYGAVVVELDITADHRDGCDRPTFRGEPNG